MSKLILAFTVLTLGLSRAAGAQTAYIGSAAHTAEVGGLEIERVPRYRARKPFEAPKTGRRAGWSWIPGRWAVPPGHGLRWDAPHWGWIGESWSWIPGHWVRRPASG